MYFEETVNVPGNRLETGLGWGGFLNPVRAIQRAVAAPVRAVQAVQRAAVKVTPPFAQRLSPVAIVQRQIADAQKIRAAVAPIIRKTSPIAVIKKQVEGAKAVRNMQLSAAKKVHAKTVAAAKRKVNSVMAVTGRVMSIGRKKPGDQAATENQAVKIKEAADAQYMQEQAAADAQLARDQADADAKFAAEKKQADEMWVKWQADQQNLPPAEQASNDPTVAPTVSASEQDLPSLGIDAEPSTWEPPSYVPYEEAASEPNYDTGETDMNMSNLPSEIMVNEGSNLYDSGMGGIWSDIMGGAGQLYSQKLGVDIQKSQAAQADAMARAEAARTAAIAVAQQPRGGLSMPLMLGLGGAAVVAALMLRKRR